MVIVLAREQAEEVAQVAADLEISVEEAVRALLSGPLSRHVGERML